MTDINEIYQRIFREYYKKKEMMILEAFAEGYNLDDIHGFKEYTTIKDNKIIYHCKLILKKDVFNDK